MNCREYRELIDDALDTSLKGGLEQCVKRHLEHCTVCQDYYERRRQEHITLFTVLNAAYADAHLPDGFADRVVAEMAAKRLVRRRAFFSRMPRWALIAASLVVIVGFVFAATVVIEGLPSWCSTPHPLSQGESELPQDSNSPSKIEGVAERPGEYEQTTDYQLPTTNYQLKGAMTMTKRKAAAAALTAAMAAAPLAAANGDEYQFIDPSTYPAANYSYATSSSAITLNAGAIPVAGVSGNLEARSRSDSSSAAIMLNALPFKSFYMTIK